MSTAKTTPQTHEEFGRALREYVRELREEIREQAHAVAEQEFPNDSDARASLTQYLLDYSFLWARNRQRGPVAESRF